MKKRIIAALLCAIMLLSFTSCGVSVGGFNLNFDIMKIVEPLVSRYTIVMETENFTLDIAQMSHYYYDTYYSYSLLSGNTSGEIYFKDGDVISGIEYGENSFTVNSGLTITEKVEIVDGDSYIIQYNPSAIGISDEFIKSAAMVRARDDLIWCEIAYSLGLSITDEDQPEVYNRVEEYMKKAINDIPSSTSSARDNDFVKELISVALNAIIGENGTVMAIEKMVLAEKAKAYVRDTVTDYDVHHEYESRYDGYEVYRVKEVYYIFTRNEYAAREIIAALDRSGNVNEMVFVNVVNGFYGVDVVGDSEYYYGDLKSEAFDEWLYDADRREGDFTAEPIYDKGQDGYYVAYYRSEGDEKWYIDIRKELEEQRISGYYSEFSSMYGSITSDKALNLVWYLIEE